MSRVFIAIETNLISKVKPDADAHPSIDLITVYLSYWYQFNFQFEAFVERHPAESTYESKRYDFTRNQILANMQWMRTNKDSLLNWIDGQTRQ